MKLVPSLRRPYRMGIGRRGERGPGATMIGVGKAESRFKQALHATPSPHLNNNTLQPCPMSLMPSPTLHTLSPHLNPAFPPTCSACCWLMTSLPCCSSCFARGLTSSTVNPAACSASMTCWVERAAGAVNLMKTAEVNHYLLQETVGHSIKAAGRRYRYHGNSKGRPIDSP